MRLVVLEPVQILVSLLADVALVRLLLLHTHSAGIWRLGVRVNDRKGAISVLMESLVVVSVRFVILQAVLVLVSFLAANHGASERFGFFVRGDVCGSVG